MQAWLARIHAAANLGNFQGTFVVSTSGRVSSSRIAHFSEGGHQFERIEALDGEKRQVFRHDETVQTFWPGRRAVTVEQRDVLSRSFPGMPQQGRGQPGESYELTLIGADRVAGLAADVLHIKPRDAWRYGYRLWADKESGLLLRVEMIDAQGQVIESSAFSEVTVDVKPQVDSVLKPMRQLDGWRVSRNRPQPTRLDAEGWALKQQPVPGFEGVNCIRRVLQDAGRPDAEGGVLALQAIYSDGLTYVSIFIEPYNPRRHAKPVETAIGATQTLMRRHGDWWITVMGDVPAATLRQFAAVLERK